MMEIGTALRFKGLFEEQKLKLLYSNAVLDEEFNLRTDDRLDEVDQSSSELETSMRMRLRNREALYLKKIDLALRRITEGEFGSCEGCGDDIEMRRLEARPMTTFCVACKETEERLELGHVDGRMPKSLGRRLQLG